MRGRAELIAIVAACAVVTGLAGLGSVGCARQPGPGQERGAPSQASRQTGAGGSQIGQHDLMGRTAPPAGLPLALKGGVETTRFLYLFNYPEGVSVEDGERWYFEEHAPQARALAGLVRFRTWRALPPIAMGSGDPYDRFVRMSELAFENLESCLNATTRNHAFWAPADPGAPGFNELECVILDEAPQYDLVRDVPALQYRYMDQELVYMDGVAPATDEPDVFIDVYMFNYSKPIPVAEDWYLGHHVREGRLFKQLGHPKHYLTWKTIEVPEEPGSTLKPNRFYRLTELGLPERAKEQPREGEPVFPGIKFTPSPHGRVLGEWRNILIDPGQVQNLME